MLENIVAWVLNNYIGEYLEDLNTDQLSVALLSGQVELDNVPLKKTALRKLDLPLEVKSGLLGKLTLSVPITHIRSEPWTLKLSDVLIVLGPLPPSRRYDVEAVEQVEQQRKEQMLEELEQRHKSNLLTIMGKTSAPSQDSWWGASLVSTVLNNIQLILNNVHIRYEDNLSLPGGISFSCGVRIQKMTVQTTNSNWKPGFVEPEDGINVFKKLELKGFSIYWNSDENIIGKDYTCKELREVLAPESHLNSFIIHPCSLELLMERNTSKFPLKGSQPRFKFFLSPNKITCELTRRQMAELRALNREWARFERSRQHRKWRPLTTVQQDARSWWQFAYGRVIDESRKTQSRRTWHFALTRARHMNAYCRAYRRRLLGLIHNPDASDAVADPTATNILMSSASQEDRTIMKQIERDSQYTYNELQMFRETVFRRLQRELEQEYSVGSIEDAFETLDSPVEDISRNSVNNIKDEGKGLYGWITSFFTADENNTTNEDKLPDFAKLDLSDLKNLPKSFSLKEMEEEILDVLHETWDDSTLLRRDALLAEVSLRLDQITLRFIDSNTISGVEQRRILAMDLMKVSSRVELSPRQSSLSVQLSVGDMSIQRLRTGHAPPKRSFGAGVDDESLMFSLAESTKILLAVGRKNSEDSLQTDPIFRMHYRRSSPRLIVRHVIEGSFKPISVMYEDNAMAGLSTLFADDPLMFKTDGYFEGNSETYTTESHVLVNIHIPDITMELRHNLWLRRGLPEWEAGEPLVCLSVYDVLFGVNSNEQHLSQIKIDIGHMECTDLMHKCNYPLLTTGKSFVGPTEPLSSSCPDLVQVTKSEVSTPSSLPVSTFLDKMPGLGSRRKAFPMESNHREVEILLTLVDSRHGLFDSKYKKNCNVEMTMNDLNLGMNRRTLTALMELAGLLGTEENGVSKADEEIEKVAQSYTIGCNLKLRTFKIDMCYPVNNTQLGTISLLNTELITTMKFNEPQETVSIDIKMEGMKISDFTPNYSELYEERLIFQDIRGPIPSQMEMNIVKYLGEDPDRDCDISLRFEVPETMHLYYVHTHRFFCGLMDFWMQFFELQDQIAKSKKEHVVEGGRSKVLLDVHVKSPTTIMLPMNQCSDQVLFLESTGIRFNNKLQRLSDVSEVFTKNFIETDYGYDENIDCLLDCGTIVLMDLCASEGFRVDANSRKTDSSVRVIGRHFFEKNDFFSSKKQVFSKKFDLQFDIFRNLDGAFSHNAPDLTVITLIKSLSWNMTTDFYILFRGVLEKNFGDPLIPVPETIPLEILQKPELGCEIGCDFKYATLSFRMIFVDVTLDMQVPNIKIPVTQLFGKSFQDFGRMELCSAQISFDVFIDGQSELDLICSSTQLIDTRSVQQGNGEKNLFPVILQPRDLTTKSKEKGLMSEAHLMMKKDEPPIVTLVLMNARVLLLSDWLNDAKDFVLLASDFVPKYYDDPSKYHPQKKGVVGRTRLEAALSVPEQTLSVKITLRDSDLYILEVPSKKNCLALVASTTAVLNMNDHGGDIEANLEVQSVVLGWCSMQHEESSMNLCSNDFSVGIGLSVENLSKHSNGLPQLSSRKHVAEIDVRGLIGRMSYKDFKVITTVLEGFQKHTQENFGKSMIPVIGIKNPANALQVDKIVFKTEHADLWVLDDYQGSSIPFLRLSFSNVKVDHIAEKIISSLILSTDYFNQKVFGWEPFIEKWNILRFLMQKKEKLQSLELIAESRCTLDINITEQLVQQAIQMSARWPSMQASLEKEEFRNSFMKTRSDHLPYLFKNETGSDIVFTTAVDDIIAARNEQRKANVKWITVHKHKEQTFEFPTKLLLYSQSEREPPRQLIIRVAGWDEISQVNVDSCGTYFRIVKAVKNGAPNARLVIRVTMEKDGKKVVAVRSSLEVFNQLPHPINVYVDNKKDAVLTVGFSESLPIPLEDAHSSFSIVPISGITPKARAGISWRNVKTAGKVLSTTQRLDGMHKDSYWLCTTVRREYYPEDETLPGHSIYIISPLTIQNLLPIDVEIQILNQVFAIGAAKQLQITSVDITSDIYFTICTDRMRSSQTFVISKPTIGEGQLLSMRLKDSNDRPLDMYANLSIGLGGAITMSLWVPYWVVNKSGIPLVIKQEAASYESSGQGEEHERAKDKHPLMFSFSDDGCPNQCVVRVGRHLVNEPGYKPVFGKRFPLTPGVQALKLKLIHDSLPTLYYNVGVEVRAGTGRYKDTQVVLLTSRYVLNNQSSYNISVCHSGEGVVEMSSCVNIASQCSLVWNEKVEKEHIRVRRSDVRHWSCPFRIDRIGSFHITMRDADETPRFIRVEIILSSAAFCVTFTDAEYFPPPLRIDNQSDVPVLYQQHSTNLVGSHLRTICKARSFVDYAWDDLYDTKRIILQVYENKSHEYDPARPGNAQPLVYENHMFFQLISSFEKPSNSRMTEEHELVLETLLRGKVTLNKQNRIDGNSGNQLWKLCSDGCIENIGMSNRVKDRMVLDVLDTNGWQLMMSPRNPSRDKYQKWAFMPGGQLNLQSMPKYFVTAKKTEVCLAENDTASPVNDDGIPTSQIWKASRQRPGSGNLEVECLHSGPTLVIKITDKDRKRAHSLPATKMSPPGTMEVSITMRSGVGISVVNGLYEELIYARFSGIVANARRVNNNYQMSASVDAIQVDNQLIGAEKVPVIFCQADSENYDYSLHDIHDLPTGVSAIIRPALKLEMDCAPMKNYDAFDCYRLKLCDMNVNLNELLMWKIVKFAQASDVAASVQQKTLSLPPNLEIDRPDPLRTRRWYFGTLELEMGQIALSVTTVSKSSLPPECKDLKQQFNVKLVSFENATVSLPPFRQYHYFETSTFLLETLQKFYFAELQKQTLNIVVTLDAFGNPLGLVTDLKDSFQGLFIEGDFQGFVAGLGYGVSNSISKMASSMASGVGSLTFDQAHELRRRNNMIRSQSTSSTPLTHLYSGVKGLGMGVIGGVTAILTNTITESRKSGIVTGTLRGITTGAVDTVTKPVQGLFDLVEGTASAMKELAGPAASGSRRAIAYERVRPPRVCRDLFHLLPPYSLQLANCQLEMLRINGYSMKERLLDVETCLERLEGDRRIVRQYVLISTKQCYVCKQINGESSSVIQSIPYKYLRTVTPNSGLANSCSVIDVRLDSHDHKYMHTSQIWCTSEMVARRLADKIMRAKHEYDHSKRTLNENSNNSYSLS